MPFWTSSESDEYHGPTASDLSTANQMWPPYLFAWLGSQMFAECRQRCHLLYLFLPQHYERWQSLQQVEHWCHCWFFTCLEVILSCLCCHPNTIQLSQCSLEILKLLKLHCFSGWFPWHGNSQQTHFQDHFLDFWLFRPSYLFLLRRNAASIIFWCPIS